ncbi:unnamed protein product [Hymenolepis diminuta]|uniref:Uncharacterized protein n=1 Tax=Hymenolepis diminuta TaxID=6216 RepID=A0A564XY07_HYMDI|nr:unnamed protein product [Hymenolepis diminuta]
MTDTTITEEMENVIVCIKVRRTKLEVARFLQVATSFVCNVKKELNEDSVDKLKEKTTLSMLY